MVIIETGHIDARFKYEVTHNKMLDTFNNEGALDTDVESN